MKDFEFGTHISMPCNLELENDVTSAIQKVAVQMQERVDDNIIREIVKAAKEQGITDLYILDKQNIIAAMRKQIPVKPLNPCGRWGGKAKGGNCPVCGSHTTSSVSNYCRKCGQALDWSDAE